MDASRLIKSAKVGVPFVGILRRPLKQQLCACSNIRRDSVEQPHQRQERTAAAFGRLDRRSIRIQALSRVSALFPERRVARVPSAPLDAVARRQPGV